VQVKSEQIINSLRERIFEYKKSDLFNSKALKQDVLSIEIAVNLFEMKLFCNREIGDEDLYWFRGGYLISMDMTGEWEGISLMYDKMAQIVLEGKSS
jgi:hypothetical protein